MRKKESIIYLLVVVVSARDKLRTTITELIISKKPRTSADIHKQCAENKQR